MSDVTEFDCVECGRHIIQIGGPTTRKCAACMALPGWFRDPELRERIDPDWSDETCPPTS